MDEVYVDTLHAELMAAYEAAGASMVWCLDSGEQADVDRHREDLRRAFRLSDSYHDEADIVVVAARSRLDGAA